MTADTIYLNTDEQDQRQVCELYSKTRIQCKKVDYAGTVFKVKVVTIISYDTVPHTKHQLV